MSSSGRRRGKMRTFKFRAWDKVVGCWSTDKDNSLAEIAIALDGTILFIRGDCDTYQPTDFIIEQFTGLRDSKGRDIYEGDILETKMSSGKTHRSIMTWDQGAAGWAKFYPLDRFEVIGNIHENPLDNIEPSA
jgi:hypothetical protein